MFCSCVMWGICTRFVCGACVVYVHTHYTATYTLHATYTHTRPPCCVMWHTALLHGMMMIMCVCVYVCTCSYSMCNTDTTSWWTCLHHSLLHNPPFPTTHEHSFKKRTIVVDTSNEIGGDGSVPHACIGDARRMPIPSNKEQHEILLRAVQNHNPQVLVVDEIGTYKEVSTVRSIAQRGVVMVGTAHGTSLSSILKNPEMNPLVGGVHAVVQGDAAARQAKYVFFWGGGCLRLVCVWWW